MEFVHELFLTAVIAVLFSFLVAKLVSVAMGGGGDCGSDSDSKDVTEEIIMEELQWGDKLKVERFQTENRVQFVEQTVKKVNDFDLKTVELPEISDSGILVEEIVTECCQLQKEEEEKEKEEEEEEEEALKVVDLPEKSEVTVEDEVELEDGNEVVESELKGGVEEAVSIDDDDDGWEGIERSELEKVFAAAVKFVDKVELGDLQRELYGLHKVATEGPCRDSQPMALMVSSRAKWNAWQRLGNMNPEVAMEQYIALLSDKVPRWMQDNSSGDSKLESPEAGISSSEDPDLSTVSPHQPNSAEDRNLELKPCAGEGDVTGVSSLENKAKE